MFSLIILVCNMSLTDCETFVSRDVYKTKQDCLTFGQNFLKDNPPPTQLGVVYQCVDWGYGA